MIAAPPTLMIVVTVSLLGCASAAGLSAPCEDASGDRARCEDRDATSLLQGAKHQLRREAWCAAPPSMSGAQSGLFEQLLTVAADALDKNQGVGPAYPHLTLGAQGFMCAAVHSVYNSAYAPPGPQGDEALPVPPDYFAQMDRDSCSIAAMANVVAVKQPGVMVQYLADLYFKGEIANPNQPVIKPRQYVFDMSPEDNPDCSRGSGCQTGPIYVWTTALRDARNQAIMAIMEEEGMRVPLSATEMTVTPRSGGGTQGGSGASYFAVPDDVPFWCQALGESCSWTQGACADEQCKGLLDNLLPAELTALQAWYSQAAPAMAAGEAPPPYTGDFEAVKRVTEVDNLAATITTFYTPVSESDLNVGMPALLGINAVGLQSGWCGEEVDGVQLSMCPSLSDGEQAAPPCVAGHAPCVSDHWVVLHGCANGVCDVWSWGAMYKVPAANLAGQTTSVISM